MYHSRCVDSRLKFFGDACYTVRIREPFPGYQGHDGVWPVQQSTASAATVSPTAQVQHTEALRTKEEETPVSPFEPKLCGTPKPISYSRHCSEQAP